MSGTEHKVQCCEAKLELTSVWDPAGEAGWGEIVMGFEDKAKKFVLDMVKKGKGLYRRQHIATNKKDKVSSSILNYLQGDSFMAVDTRAEQFTKNLA